MAVVARTINALKAKGRKTVSLSGVHPHVQVHSHPGKVGEEERFRYQEINAVAESFLHGGSGTKSLTYSSASCIVSRIHVILPNKPHTLDRAPPIRVGRFHQKRTCPDYNPWLLSIDHHSLRM
jgi:hypothetical protein